MFNTPDKYILKLREVAEKKHEYLKDILCLTREQSRAVTDEDIEALGKLVTDKQAKIDAINKLDKEFDACFQQLKCELKVDSLDKMQGLGLKGIKELQESIERVMVTIAEICDIENQNTNGAKVLLNNLGEEIKKISRGKKAVSAYKPGPVRPPSFYIDKKK